MPYCSASKLHQQLGLDHPVLPAEEDIQKQYNKMRGQTDDGYVNKYITIVLYLPRVINVTACIVDYVTHNT